MELRFGFSDGSEKTQKQVADLLGISNLYFKVGKEDSCQIKETDDKGGLSLLLAPFLCCPDAGH